MQPSEIVFWIIMYLLVALGFWCKTMDFNNDELNDGLVKFAFAMIWPGFIPFKIGMWIAT